MKVVRKLSFLIAVVCIVISAQFLPSAYQIHYMMVLFIIVFGILSMLVKTYKQVQLIPGVGKYHEELDCELISSIMGNLFWMITIMLAIFEIGELFYSGVTRTFIWFSILPIAIYSRIMSKKIRK